MTFHPRIPKPADTMEPFSSKLIRFICRSSPQLWLFHSPQNAQGSRVKWKQDYLWQTGSVGCCLSCLGSRQRKHLAEQCSGITRRMIRQEQAGSLFISVHYKDSPEFVCLSYRRAVRSLQWFSMQFLESWQLVRRRARLPPPNQSSATTSTSTRNTSLWRIFLFLTLALQPRFISTSRIICYVEGNVSFIKSTTTSFSISKNFF